MSFWREVQFVLVSVRPTWPNLKTGHHMHKVEVLPPLWVFGKYLIFIKTKRSSLYMKLGVRIYPKGFNIILKCF